jgi:hypothetical protein
MTAMITQTTAIYKYTPNTVRGSRSIIQLQHIITLFIRECHSYSLIHRFIDSRNQSVYWYAVVTETGLVI